MGLFRKLYEMLSYVDPGERLRPPPLSPASVSELFDDMQQEITRVKPLLAMEWRKLYYEDPYEAGHWLDANFPIPGGWGHHLITDGPRIMRGCYPSYGPVDPSLCP